MLTKPAGCFLQVIGGGTLLVGLAILLDGGWGTKGIFLSPLGFGIIFLGGLPAIQKK
jgi:hypothetical protein